MQDFKDRKHDLPLTDLQWEALARGKNIEDVDPDLPGWWVLEIEPAPKNWVLLSSFEDVNDTILTKEMFDDDEIDVAPVWMDDKGEIRLEP